MQNFTAKLSGGKTFGWENFHGWYANDHSWENFCSCLMTSFSPSMKPIE